MSILNEGMVATTGGAAAAVKPAPVIGEGGWAGWLLGPSSAADGTPMVTIQIEPEATRLLVPAEIAMRGADGVYRVPFTREALLNASAVADAAASVNSDAQTVITRRPDVAAPPPVAGVAAAATREQVVIPVVEERLSISTERIPAGGVRVHKSVTERQEVVERPVTRDEVSVERVPVNRVIEGPPPGVRQEGEVMVVPLIEEVLVVEKRLVLREEVRIHLRREMTHDTQTVTLRREEAHVERFGPDDSGPEDVAAASSAAAPITERPAPAVASGWE